MKLADTYCEILKRDFGINISDDLKNEFALYAAEAEIKKNELIIKIGEKNNYLSFIISGVLRDYYIDDKGSDITHFFSCEGGMCGGQALISDEPSAICTEALTDCTLLRCPVSDFKRIVAENAEAAKMYMWLLEKSLAYKIRRENSFLTKSAAERYISFKAENPTLEKRINQKYIASYLGITPVSLSRIRRALKEED